MKPEPWMSLRLFAACLILSLILTLGAFRWGAGSVPQEWRDVIWQHGGVRTFEQPGSRYAWWMPAWGARPGR